MTVATNWQISEMEMVTVRVSLQVRAYHPSIILAEIETAVIRWNYGDPTLGACKETIEGGNHFRYWPQNGPSGNRCVGLSLCLSIFAQRSLEQPSRVHGSILRTSYSRCVQFYVLCVLHWTNLQCAEQHDLIDNG